MSRVISLRDLQEMVRTGQDVKKIANDTDRDFYLSAEEAKEYGLIDEVIKTKD